MSAAAPPLRFLMIVLGGWLCIRSAILVPGWWVEEGVAANGPPPALDPLPITRRVMPLSNRLPMLAAAPAKPSRLTQRSLNPVYGSPIAGASVALLSGPVPAAPLLSKPATGSLSAPPTLAMPLRLPPDAGRWSASAWLLVRQSRGGTPLAPGGLLGGDQAGARLLYRLNGSPERALSLSGRLYAPLGRPGSAEAAVGVDWRPIAGIPVNILAERRQALGREGRSAFSLTLYGGRSLELRNGIRLETYAQAGIVGARRRDLFADGAVRIGVPVGPVEIGGGAWAAAQPGARRLDVGPQVSFRLPVERMNLRVSADWRLRVAGNAEPGSGPALTLGTDF